ncbi:MAG: hypothetical protein Q9181_003877 [Wetmoreana brouardii]
MSKLRKLTGTEVVKYQPASNRMEHPNHNREFKSRNLWCVQHQGYCGSCKVACCVYEETVEAGKQARDHYTKQLVSEVGKVILAASTFNEEPSTFLKCGECARFFCPKCIGICPVDMCHFQVTPNSPYFRTECEKLLQNPTAVTNIMREIHVHAARAAIAGSYGRDQDTAVMQNFIFRRAYGTAEAAGGSNDFQLIGIPKVCSI